MPFNPNNPKDPPEERLPSPPDPLPSPPDPLPAPPDPLPAPSAPPKEYAAESNKDAPDPPSDERSFAKAPDPPSVELTADEKKARRLKAAARERYKRNQAKKSDKERKAAKEKDRLRKQNAKESQTEEEREAAKEKDRLRKQNAKESQTEEEREAAKEKHRLRKQNAKESQTEEEREAAKEKDRLRKQNAKESQTEEEREAAKEKQKLYKQHKRAGQSEEQKEAERQSNASRIQQIRAGQSEEQKEAERQSNASRIQQIRAGQSEEQKEAERQSNASRIQQIRDAQTPAERYAANEIDRLRMQQTRAAQTQEVRNAELRRRRQRRAEIQDELNQRPIGARCNWDYFESTGIETFDIRSKGTFECTYCQAKGYKHHENRGTDSTPHMGILCCNKGTKMLPPLPPTPERLEALLRDNTQQAKRFRKNPRYFNNTMALGSIQANDVSVQGSGPSSYRVCGQLFRRIGPLRNSEGIPPVCGQTYLHDPQYQDRHRATRSGSRNEDEAEQDEHLFQLLREILINDAQNRLIQSYLTIDEYITRNNLDPDDHAVVLLDKVPTDEHPGRYNLPTAPEIALLLLDDVPTNTHNKNVVLSVRDNGGGNALQFIPYENVNYETVMYPLLFPDGNATRWHPGLRSTEGKKVSLADYVRYHMQQSDLRDNRLLRYNRLWQQYVLDMFERNEAYKLQYLRSDKGQKKIRAELYKGVVDNVNSGDGNISQVGKSTILPATYTGSDRWYHKRYKNAMALVAKHGKPTLFLTFTMDVNCPEVKAELHNGQSPYDRPHLLNRIFQGKRKQLIDEITKKRIFGKVIAHVHVVEFQKRGAPHLHLLIWIEDFNPTPENIDSIISAEIPPPNDPLHKPVTELMMHGPCTYDKMNLSCIRDSKDGETCKRNYPRDFTTETRLDEGSFGVYRRRSPEEGGYTASKKLRIRGRLEEVQLDNRWVVPYSPYLLKRFGCHINVEYCATVVSVKYLFMYHFKGGDKVTIEERNKDDEVHIHQTRKYLSANEGAFRFMEYELSLIQPPVVQLPIHLPNEQQVYFEPTIEDATAALERAAMTELLGYFAANEQNLYSPYANCYARDLKYEDFLSAFVFTTDKEKNKKWTPRQRGPVSVGRMISMHPKRGQLFYLRMLLKHTIGKTSFEDLRTVDGEVQETFQAACVALNLCEDDSHWDETMEEAIFISSARSIRELFTTILLECEVSTPLNLYEKHCEAMKDDFIKKYTGQMSTAQVDQRATNDLLIYINNKCKDAGKQSLEYGLPMPQQEEATDDLGTPPDEIDENAAEHVQANEQLLNEKQRILVDKVSHCLQHDEQGLYGLDSPGGTGKTFTSNYLLAMVRQNEDIAIATALSGIAATLLIHGTTFHKRFAAPIPCFKDSTSNIKGQTLEARIVRQAKLIIVDEVSMMSFKLLDVLDRLLQDLMQNDLPMGGKNIVLLYDFRQLLPVVPGKGRADVVSETVHHSKVWSKFEKLSLDQNMRVQTMIDQYPERETELREHEQWLLDVGSGTVQTAHSNIIEIPTHMVCKSRKELEDKVYADFELNYSDPTYLKSRAIMSTTNEIIQQCNFDMISRIPGDVIVSESRDSCVNDDDTTLYDEAVLNRINVSGIPPHRLALKKGACIILIKNLNIREGHCNGTRYIIENMTNRLIDARRLTDNAQLLIPRIPIISNDSSFPIPFKRLQFPVLGAYYLTINRAQGQTLQVSGLYLERSVFTHGALYVPLSRGGAPWLKYIYANQDEFKHLHKELDLENKTYTRNVVYKEVLN